MRISVRIEGGLGDHFAANRFIPAIKEKYPSCSIDLYSDTEGNKLQSSILNEMWPSHFNNTFIIEEKKYEKLKIKCANFPDEDYPSSIKNVPDKIYKKMASEYDLFYDLHIDSLGWLKHDYDWLKYFKTFPTPENRADLNIKTPDNFILAHLYARDKADSNMEDWYIEKLIENISQEFDIIILYDEQSEHKYKKLIAKNLNKVHFIHASLREIFYLSSKCVAAFGVDSGIRYIPYHYSKPTFTFSKYCKQYGKVQYSYLIRWLFDDKFILPMHHDVKTSGQIIKNTLRNPAYKLYPFLLDNIEKLIGQRDITEYITE